jgi:hypothetical protein
MNNKVITIASAAGLALVALFAAAVGTAGGPGSRAHAAKPPKLPTATPGPSAPLDGGWIYYGAYLHTDDANVMHRISPDGTVGELVPGAPANNGSADPSWGVPSVLPHDGDRWYLAHTPFNNDIVFPNIAAEGRAREIEVVREGAPGITLTANRAACIFAWSIPVWVRSASGTPDAAIAWSGAQWADLDGDPAGDCETLVSGGIFRADLLYDGSGAITGMAPPALVVPVPVRADNTPNADWISWSPDGASVVYPRTSDGLYVAAVGGSLASQVRIVTGHYHHVGWSADQDPGTAGLQTTIAFTGSSSNFSKRGVWSIQPNGGGLKLLAEAKQGKNSSQPSYIHADLYWSPAGTHLAYREHGYGGSLGFLGVHSLRRMAANGSGNVVLVMDSATLKLARITGWADVDAPAP